VDAQRVKKIPANTLKTLKQHLILFLMQEYQILPLVERHLMLPLVKHSDAECEKGQVSKAHCHKGQDLQNYPSTCRQTSGNAGTNTNM